MNYKSIKKGGKILDKQDLPKLEKNINDVKELLLYSILSTFNSTSINLIKNNNSDFYEKAKTVAKAYKKAQEALKAIQKSRSPPTSIQIRIQTEAQEEAEAIKQELEDMNNYELLNIYNNNYSKLNDYIDNIDPNKIFKELEINKNIFTYFMETSYIHFQFLLSKFYKYLNLNCMVFEQLSNDKIKIGFNNYINLNKNPINNAFASTIYGKYTLPLFDNKEKYLDKITKEYQLKNLKEYPDILIVNIWKNNNSINKQVLQLAKESDIITPIDKDNIQEIIEINDITYTLISIISENYNIPYIQNKFNHHTIYLYDNTITVEPRIVYTLTNHNYTETTGIYGFRKPKDFYCMEYHDISSFKNSTYKYKIDDKSCDIKKITNTDEEKSGINFSPINGNRILIYAKDEDYNKYDKTKIYAQIAVQKDIKDLEDKINQKKQEYKQIDKTSLNEIDKGKKLTKIKKELEKLEKELAEIKNNMDNAIDEKIKEFNIDDEEKKKEEEKAKKKQEEEKKKKEEEEKKKKLQKKKEKEAKQTFELRVKKLESQITENEKKKQQIEKDKSITDADKAKQIEDFKKKIDKLKAELAVLNENKDKKIQEIMEEQEEEEEEEIEKLKKELEEEKAKKELEEEKIKKELEQAKQELENANKKLEEKTKKEQEEKKIKKELENTKQELEEANKKLDEQEEKIKKYQTKEPKELKKIDIESIIKGIPDINKNFTDYLIKLVPEIANTLDTDIKKANYEKYKKNIKHYYGKDDIDDDKKDLEDKKILKKFIDSYKDKLIKDEDINNYKKIFESKFNNIELYLSSLKSKLKSKIKRELSNEYKEYYNEKFYAFENS